MAEQPSVIQADGANTDIVEPETEGNNPPVEELDDFESERSVTPYELKLRKENERRRKENEELKQKLDALASAAEERLRQDETELESAQRQLQDMQTQLERSNERARQLELENIVGELGNEYEFTTHRDIMGRIATEGPDLYDSAGELDPDAVEKYVKKLAKSSPHLLRSKTDTWGSPDAAPRDSKPRTKTEQERLAEITDSVTQRFGLIPRS